MRIQSINYILPKPVFGAQKSRMPQASHTPMSDGLSTAGAWFGFGVVLDFVSRKCRFSKSPLKNSIALNGIIGLGAGAVTGVKEFYNHDKKEA